MTDPLEGAEPVVKDNECPTCERILSGNEAEIYMCDHCGAEMCCKCFVSCEPCPSCGEELP